MGEAMPLMRLKCTQCHEMFEQTTRHQRRCLPCRTPQMRYRNEMARLRQRIVELEAMVDHHAWQTWLAQQLEPYLGNEALNPIIMKLLGREEVTS
jgi:hypothetical protein